MDGIQCLGLDSDTISLNSATLFEWRLIMSGFETGETPHSDNTPIWATYVAKMLFYAAFMSSRVTLRLCAGLFFPQLPL